MKQIERSFAELQDTPCWGVKRGQGSFLTFEFGSPRLVIREPISSHARSRKVRRMLDRRHVRVTGEWHLWIYCCDWVVYSGTSVVGDSSTRRRVTAAARLLDGQKLRRVVVSKRGARTRFEFDLGGVLETRPYDRKSEQWMLYDPHGHVLTFRADRSHKLRSGPAGPSGSPGRSA